MKSLLPIFTLTLIALLEPACTPSGDPEAPGPDQPAAPAPVETSRPAPGAEREDPPAEIPSPLPAPERNGHREPPEGAGKPALAKAVEESSPPPVEESSPEIAAKPEPPEEVPAASKPATSPAREIPATGKGGEKSATPESTGPRSEPPEGPPPFLLAIEPAAGGPMIEIPIVLDDPRVGTYKFGKEAEIAGARLSLRRYSPMAFIQEKLVPAPGGFTALKLQFGAGNRRNERWLVPGSRLLGRLAVPGVLLEYLPELSPEDLAWKEVHLRELHTPAPKILVEEKRSGRLRLLPAREKEVLRLDHLDYSLEILRMFRSFALDPSSGMPMDRKTGPHNPAVEVRVTRAGRTRTAWLFSKLPEFSREGEDDEVILRFVYPGSGQSRPEVTIIDSSSGPMKAFAGVGGGFESGEIPLKGTTTIGGVRMGIAERIHSARIQQTFREDIRGTSAVLIAWEKSGLKGERWIPLRVPEELRIGDALFWARLRMGTQGAHGMSPHGGGEKKSPGVYPGLPEGHPKIEDPLRKLPRHPPIRKRKQSPADG